MVEMQFSNSDSSWIILSEIEQNIKKKIEAVGTPLKDWNIKIYRGVLTGCNDAFIISTGKRAEILQNCQSEEERAKTDQIIRPILRGKDIKKYGYEWKDLWIIATHNGIRDKKGNIKIPRIDINDYPAVKKYLDQYWEVISYRCDKGDTPYNLRSCAYWEDFNEPKICWKSVGETLYSLVPEKYLLLDTSYFFTTEEPLELLAILNSKLILWWVNLENTMLGENATRHYKYNLEKLCIPNTQNLFKNEIQGILNQQNVLENIKLINQTVYKLYKLTDEEINYIENISI